MLENLFMQILDMTKTASIVIAVVFVARLLLKKAPKWISYALWGVVLLRLLCPFSLEAPVSAVPRMESVSESYTLADDPISVVGAAEAATQAVGDALNGGLGVQHIRTTEKEENGGDVYVTSLWWEVWVLFGQYVWLFGIAVMLIYSAVSYIRLRRRLVGAVPLRDNIYLADRIASPFVMGIILPKIYLPSALSEREQEYIILHEQRHIRRLDHVVKVLAFAALCLHWFNPLVWLAFILAGKDMEMSCDESVIKTLGSEIRADYSASLLSLATGRRLIAGTPLAFGEGDTRGRIKNLAKWKKPVIWVVIIVAIICAALAVCLLTDPVDKGDILRSVEREHDIVRPGLEAAYEMELGDEVKSGTVVAEIWTNGECRQSIPVTFTDADAELNISMHLRKEGEKYSGVEIEVNPSPDAGSLITYFPIPEYYEYLGWSTTAYKVKDEVKVKPGEAEIMAAMAFDVGNGVRAMDCQSLTEEPWRLKEYECIIIILAGFSAEEVPTQQVTMAESEPAIEVLQLHHVIKLAEKGYELGWEDFENFDYYETGSGLYIRVYEIDETFTLSIAGKYPAGGTEPMYIYLSANDLDNRIDIRDGGVEEFIETVQLENEAEQKKDDIQAELVDKKISYRLMTLKPEDIKEITGAEGIDPTAMAEALNSAATNPIEPVENFMGHWNVDVYTSVGDECLRLYAGAEKNVVMMYYHTDKSEHTTWYFKDIKLYELIRGSFTYEGIVDEESLAEYEGIIATRAEGIIREYNRIGEGRFTGYELTEFCKYDSFQHRNNIDFDIYRCNIAFIPEDPDEIAWAGGMWLDSELRVRDYDLYTYLVVRSVDGEMVDYNFMFYDIYTGAGTDEERRRAHNEILNAWGEE